LVDPVAAHALNPSALTGNDAPVVHTAAQITSPLANATRTAPPYTPDSTDGDDADGDDPASSTTPSTRTVGEVHPGERPQLPGSDTTEQYPDDRERETENHTVPQLARNDAQTTTTPNQPNRTPANQIGSPMAFGVASVGPNEDHTERMIRASGEPVSASFTVSATVVSEEGMGGAANSPSAPEFGCVPITPAASAPPATSDRAIPPASASEGDPNPPGWCRVLLDPLVGVPLRDAIALDLAALGTEAEALFEHLANLGPEWTSSAEWTEYVYLAAGVLLVGGGAYFARSAAPGTKSTRMPLELREEGP
jgi:hypothetical protein